MLATGAAGLAVYKLLKRTFVRERPFIRHAGISLAQAPLDRYSFPSGHTLHAVASPGRPARRFPRLGFVLVPLALAIAASRVVLGLHYPTDVLVGALLGAIGGADRRGARLTACGYCSSPTSTSRGSTASPPPSAPSAPTSRDSAWRPCSSRPNIRGAAPDEEPGDHPRALGRGAAAIPRIGASCGALIARCSMPRCAREGRPRAHPHAVHRALRRRRVSRAQHGLPRGRDLSHVLRGLSASLRAHPAARHRPLPRAPLHALPMRRCRGADFAQRADARGTAGVRRRHAHRSAAHRTSGRQLHAAATVRGSASASRCRPTGRCCCTWAAWPTRRTSTSCCACSCALRAAPARCDVRDRRRRPGAGHLVKLARAARHRQRRCGSSAISIATRTSGLLCGRRCIRIRVAHRDPGAGAARGDGAGHAGGFHRRARHALHSHRRLRCLRGARRRGRFAAAVTRGAGAAGGRSRAVRNCVRTPSRGRPRPWRAASSRSTRRC